MRVLISGTSSGIGRAIAEKFISEGCFVTGVDIKEPSVTDERYEHINADIFRGPFPELDVHDIVINCAGKQQGDDVIDVNLKGTMAFNEKYGMRKGVRSILFIASASASTGSEFTEYAASKGGVLAYMKNCAIRGAKLGIICNSLSPGGVITDSNRHILENKDLYDAVLNETLTGKWATEEEIAEWAYFLTAVNKSMTGGDVLVDNGEASKANFIW